MTRKNLVRISLILLCVCAAAVLYFARYSPSARRATHLARGDQHFQAQEYDKAKLEYQVVLKNDAANPTAIGRLGNIWLLQGAPAHAMPHLARLKQLVPDDLANRQKVIAALIELGDFPNARKEAEELLQRAPKDDEAWIGLALSAPKDEVDLIGKRVERAGASRLATSYAQGVLALKKRDLPAAERHLGEALAQDPRFYRAHMALADVHFLKRDNLPAAESLKAGSSSAPARSRERLRFPEYRAMAGDALEAKREIMGVIGEAQDFIPAWVLLARIAFGQKEYPEAQAALEKVFARDAVNYDGRLLEAEIQIAKPDPKAAIEILERLTKLYPSAVAAKFQLGRAYALADRSKDAVAVLRQAVAINPALINAQALLAELHLRAGQPQAVIESLLPLVERQPNLGRVELLLADAYRMLKRYDPAVAIYRRHADAAPQNPLPWIFLGTTYREQGNDAEARAAFENALTRAPNHLAVLNHLVELDLKRNDFAAASGRLLRLDPKVADSATAKVLTARIQGAQQLWPQAEESLLAAIAVDPDQATAYQLLIALYYEKGRFADAIKRLEEKLTRAPDDVGSRLLLARIHEEQKNYDAARIAYEAAVKSRPDSIAALNNLAYLCSERLGDSARALELAQKARTLYPADPSVADTLGWIRYRTGDFEGAVVLLRESASKLAERGEVPAEVNYHLGMALMAVGQFDSAQGLLSKAAANPRDFVGKADIPLRLELLRYAITAPASLTMERLLKLSLEAPADPFVQFRMGEALEATGKLAEAVSAYERVLKLSPKFAAAAANLARLHATVVPNPTKALEYAKSARESAPSDPAIAASLGTTMSQLGDQSWAYNLLQQATAQADAAPDTLFELARVAYSLGRAKEAEKTFERIVAAAPNGLPADRAKMHLRLLQITDQRGPETGAEQAVAACLEKDPGNLFARMASAAIAERKKDWDAASLVYRDVLKKHPAFPIAQARLAAIQLQSGNWTEAHDLAVAARKAMPDDSLSALVLGETSFRKKDYRRSADYLTEAARSRPLDGRRLFILGAAYFELQNRPRSEACLKQALEAELPSADRVEAERMLKELRG